MIKTRLDLRRTGPLDAPARTEIARLIRAERAQEPVPEQAGTVVEFRRGGQLLCGYLERPPKGFFRVMGVDGRARRLRRDKIVDVSRDVVGAWPPSEAMKSLQAVNEAREAARQSFDLETLWRVVTEAHGHRHWALEQLLELHESGQVDGTRRAGLLRALWQGPYFDRDGTAWRPRTDAAVEQLREAVLQDIAQSQRQSELADWLRRVADGGPVDPRPADTAAAITLLERAAVGDESRASSALMQAAHLHGAGGAFEVLVRLGYWDADENLELHRLRVPDEFSAAVAAAARQIPADAAPHGPGRRRWGGGSYAAATGERAYRLRRNLWGRRVLDVHLAVPALWVQTGGAIDADAAERGTALQLVERQIPMLPTAVLQACRLLPAAARPALTLSMRLSDELQPQHVALKLSRLRPQARLDEPALHATSGWRQLADLARALRQQRRRTGAWEGLRPTPWLTRHEDQVQQATESTAELIDAELRLLAAAALGCYCQDHSIAALYVTRAAGTAQDLDTDVCWPATTDAEGLRAFLLERQAAPTALTTEPGINVGLGLPLVAAGTQPMRRYVDLVMQRQLLAAAGAGGALLSPEALRIAVLDTHAAREAAHQVESASQRYWSLKWVEQLPPDDGVSCVVVEPRGPGYLALLAGGPAGAFAPATGGERVHVAPGQRLRLRVEQVSARRNILRLADPRPQ